MSTSAANVAERPRARTSIELAIGGMTCASCASRIEKKLNRMPGVTASVNYATEKATIVVDDATVTVEDLIATVERTGYTAKLPAPPPQDEKAGDDQTSSTPPSDELRGLR